LKGKIFNQKETSFSLWLLETSQIHDNTLEMLLLSILVLKLLPDQILPSLLYLTTRALFKD
jgi:hypothetical protein